MEKMCGRKAANKNESQVGNMTRLSRRLFIWSAFCWHQQQNADRNRMQATP